MTGAFTSGAVMMGAAAIALLFLRSWRQTRDRLFVLFAAAFALLALERWLLLLVPQDQAERSLVYLVRLAAFVLILLAILDKNRPGTGSAQRQPPT